MTSAIGNRVKVGGPVAEGVLFTRRVRAILDQRDSAFARIDMECRARLKALCDDAEVGTTPAGADETASETRPDVSPA